MYSGMKGIYLALIGVLLMNFTTLARAEKKHRQGSLYFSWGYNKEWYTRSNVHVKQSEQGNDYKLMNVKSHDNPGWNEKGSIFAKQLTIPQYNYRLGYYFNEKQDLAIEINFDHTKHIIQDGQNVRMKGTFNGNAVDSNVTFSHANGCYYYLNNGANFFLINIVKRWGLYSSRKYPFRVDFTGKFGIGPVVPHVENSFFGQRNDPHFQLGGWNTGIETALRATITRFAYLEFAQKVDYARYSNLKIYNGTARQSFGTYELILSLGLTIPTTKNNPLFTKPAAAEAGK
ncbi:MAG: hypothetical protein K0Q79_2114 [Flavipsychrobacter sp.]|jgi:hypothetical protein|nr:hypothetical protein [Flavipsychrobacter sp.]